MRKFPILLLLALFISACVTMEMIRAKNRENLNRLSIGLSKSEILQVMGTQTIRAEEGFNVIHITNPYRTEILKGKDGQMYEVLFYYTDVKKADGAITDDELTPIVVKDGKLIGWGWAFLNENVTKYHYQIDIR